MKALLYFIPLVFFVYFLKKGTIVAAEALLISSTVVYVLLFILQKFRLEKAQWLLFGITAISCSLTLYFRNDFFLRWKAPILSVIFGLGFLLSPIIGSFFNQGKTTLAERMFGVMLHLSEKGWLRLNYVWAGFYFLIATVQAVLATMPQNYWAYFKPGAGLLSILLVVIQLIVLRAHTRLTEDNQQ